MTLKKWLALYKAYKDHFDLEQKLKIKQLCYADIDREITIDDVIPL